MNPTEEFVPENPEYPSDPSHLQHRVWDPRRVDGGSVTIFHFSLLSYLISTPSHLKDYERLHHARHDETSLLSPHVDHEDTSCSPHFILMSSSLLMHALHASYMLLSFRTCCFHFVRTLYIPNSSYNVTSASLC